MIALVGFIMIALIVALLLKGKMSPIVVLALIPTVAALILGYNPKDVAGFIKEGIGTTTSNGILFIFSVIYFGVMSDTGMFDVIVNFLVKRAGRWYSCHCPDRHHSPSGRHHGNHGSDYHSGSVSGL